MTSIKILAFPAFKNKDSNPYNFLMYSGIEAQNVEVSEFSFISCLGLNYDVIHIHWPEIYLNSHYFTKALFNSVIFLVCLRLAKLCGKKIVWTVHNLKPHQIRYQKLNAVFWPIYLHFVDGIISLSHCNEKQLFKTFKSLRDLPSIAIHHGLYKGFYTDAVTKTQARQRLSIEQNHQVCLFIGQIKPYKNIEHLISLFNSTPQLRAYILIIAGKFESDEYFQKINTVVKANHNIIIHNRFIPDDDLQIYFRAADLCILPFSNIFNSGSVLLSASFDTPVLVPENANFNEYAALLDDGLIYTYHGQLSSDDILQCYKTKTMSYKTKTRDINTQTPDISSTSKTWPVPEIISWPNLQRKMVGFYKQVIRE